MQKSLAFIIDVSAVRLYKLKPFIEKCVYQHCDIDDIGYLYDKLDVVLQKGHLMADIANMSRFKFNLDNAIRHTTIVLDNHDFRLKKNIFIFSDKKISDYTLNSLKNYKYCNFYIFSVKHQIENTIHLQDFSTLESHFKDIKWH